MVDTRLRRSANLSLLLIAILRWDVVSVRAFLDLVISLASFNKLSRNISKALDMMSGTEEPILPTSSSDCIILLILDGEKRASYFFLFVGIIFGSMFGDQATSYGPVQDDHDCDGGDDWWLRYAATPFR